MTRVSICVLSLLISTPAFCQETKQYQYDVLGRLTTSTTSGGPNSGTQAKIVYDGAGNRVSYSVTGASGSASGQDPGSSASVPASVVKVIVVPLNGLTTISVSQ